MDDVVPRRRRLGKSAAPVKYGRCAIGRLNDENRLLSFVLAGIINWRCYGADDLVCACAGGGKCSAFYGGGRLDPVEGKDVTCSHAQMLHLVQRKKHKDIKLIGISFTLVLS